MNSERIALVTGAYQGIGRGIADLLSKNGYHVIYSDVFDAMEGVDYIKLDISSAADRENALRYIDEKYGSQYILWPIRCRRFR